MREDFETVIRRWAALNLDFALDDEAVIERRGRELTELCIWEGLSQELAEAARPYQTISGYVKALRDEVRRTRGK